MSIYFLHIPRTAGTYLTHNVRPHLISGGVEHFTSNRSKIDAEKIKKCEYVSGHFGLMPVKLMKNPMVFSVVRNPVDLFISYFRYTTGFIRTKKQIEEKKESWLYGKQSINQSNLQSKFLTGSTNIDKFNEGFGQQTSVNNIWFLENYNTDIDIVKNNINQFNVYSFENRNRFLQDYSNMLQEMFGFTSFKYNDKINASHHLDIDFSKEEIERIKYLNSVDMEIYEYVREIEKR